MVNDVLYDSEKIKIAYISDSPEPYDSIEGYGLLIGNSHFVLGSSDLDELAKTQIIDLKKRLNAIDPHINDALSQNSVFYTDLDFALKQAKIRDLKNQVDDSARKYTYVGPIRIKRSQTKYK